MKKVALSKVAKIDRTVATDDECLTLPYVGLEHVEKESGKFVDGFVPTPLNMLATNFRFTPKHVLYGKLRPYLNKVVLPNFDGVCTTEILPILPNEEKLDRTFLWAILLSPTFVSWATSQISGANLPRLDPKLLADYEIPLPPLDEQKRIASLLARADRLRSLRRHARALADSLLQSVFLEMFGDGKYDLMEFREAVKIDRTPASEEDVKTLPYVGLEDVEKDTGDFAKEYRPMPQNMLATNFKFTPKHVLYGKLRPYLNKVVMPSFSGVCTTEILPLLPVEGKLNKTYLWAYLRSKKFVDWASNNVAGANLPRLSPELLGDYPLPLPPLPLQEEFARVAARVEGLRARQAEAERQAEELFQSLLALSFTEGLAESFR